ncbi:MAG: UDP-glucose 4-epimerase GalE [Aestuariivirga sp.]
MTGRQTVLVTGGAGYIGSHAVLALRDAEFEVVVLDNLSTGQQCLIAEDVSLVVGDIGDQELIRRIVTSHQIKAVMHFAGSAVVAESTMRPLDYYQNNTVKSHALIQSCVDAGVENFIFSSSAAVYGIPDILPVDENVPTRPINPYGSSKLMTEWILRDVGAVHALNYVSLRYFNVAGADPLSRTGQSTPNATHLIKVACEVAIGLRPAMSIYGVDYNTPDGTCIRDYIHVTDLATAHVLALQYLRAGGASTILNCGYGRGYSVREVLSAVAAVAGSELATIVGPRRPGDPPELVANVNRIKHVLGWCPRYDALDVIVQSSLDWERRARLVRIVI